VMHDCRCRVAGRRIVKPRRRNMSVDSLGGCREQSRVAVTIPPTIVRQEQRRSSPQVLRGGWPGAASQQSPGFARRLARSSVAAAPQFWAAAGQEQRRCSPPVFFRGGWPGAASQHPPVLGIPREQSRDAVAMRSFAQRAPGAKPRRSVASPERESWSNPFGLLVLSP